MIRTTKDARTIRTGSDYVRFRIDVAESQQYRCAMCGRSMFLTRDIELDDSCHLHHRKGRGMGGSKRDDTPEMCVALCGKCHREIHAKETR